jgi:hypothetical protein
MDDKSISYRYDSNGYRSENLQESVISPEIVFSGCSVTFGTGLNFSDTWPNMLSEKISNKSVINLGIDGASHKHIFSDIASFFKDYKNPKAVFILFPNLERYPVFLENKGQNFVSSKHYEMDNTRDSDYRSVLSKESVLFDFLTHIRMLETYCKSNNIILRWGTWDIFLEESLNEILSINYNFFDSYTQIYTGTNNEMVLYELEKTKSDNKFWDLARNNHPGVRDQTLFSEIFWRSLSKEEKERLVA